jgi:hypothetical protein
VIEGLGRLLHRWRHSGTIAAWASSGVPNFVEQHFVALVAYEQTARATLRSLFALPFVKDPGNYSGRRGPSGSKTVGGQRTSPLTKRPTG